MKTQNLAFSPDAMSLCESKGHSYRHVRGWHAVGWQECYRCGATLSNAWTPTVTVAPVLPTVVYVASELITVAETIAAVNDATERISAMGSTALKRPRPQAPDGLTLTPKRPRSHHAPRAPKGVFSRGERVIKSTRNAEVLAMLAAGKSTTKVAEHFKLTPPRIGQIVRAYAPADFVRPPMGGAEKKRERDARNAEILRRKAAGEEPKDIAVSVGVSRDWVNRILSRNAG